MMDLKDIEKLLSKLARKEATDAEKRQLEQELMLVSEEEYLKLLHFYENLCRADSIDESVDLSQYITLEKAIDDLEGQRVGRQAKLRWMLLSREFAATAAILVLSALLSIYILKAWTGHNEDKTFTTELVESEEQDVLPGEQKAFLQLENGHSWALDEMESSDLSKITGYDVAAKDKGLISFYGAKSQSSLNQEIQTITTPKGGTYRVVLSDGTKVWLNAESSITFPVDFGTTGKRIVDVTGEVFFEVTTQLDNNSEGKRPFYVNVGTQRIAVLGTEFNVKAYNDSPFIATTLVEGRVAVERRGEEVILEPGQQAQVSPERGIEVKVDVDLDEVVAWKKGNFYFADTDIQTVMQEIARWYNVDVVYSGSTRNIRIGGQVSRSKNLSEVLRIFELTGELWFAIKGKTIEVEIKD